MTGICQSDHRESTRGFADVDYVCGDWRLAPMEGIDCTGHEGAGVVAAVGPGVTGWKVGDRVGITPVASTVSVDEGRLGASVVVWSGSV